MSLFYPLNKSLIGNATNDKKSTRPCSLWEPGAPNAPQENRTPRTKVAKKSVFGKVKRRDCHTQTLEAEVTLSNWSVAPRVFVVYFLLPPPVFPGYASVFLASQGKTFNAPLPTRREKVCALPDGTHALAEEQRPKSFFRRTKFVTGKKRDWSQ